MEWQVEDRQPNTKSSEWYLAVGIIVLAVAGTAVIFKNILLAVLIVIAFVSIVLNHRRKNQILNVAITRKGIKIDDLLYTFDNLESFHVDEGRDLLILKSKKFFSTHIMIPIEGVSPEELEQILGEYLESEEMRESALEQFLEYLGF